MAEKIFDILWFDWWEWDDKYRVPDRWFYSGENIEIRKDLWWVQLSQLLEDTGRSISWDITCITSLDTIWVSGWWVVVCTDTGRVYLNGTLKKTFSTGTTPHNRIYGIGVNTKSDWTQYIYYVTGTSFWTGKIHRSTTDLSTFTDNHREYEVASGSIDYVWVINNVWLLYLAMSNKVFILDREEILLDYLVLPDKEKIRFISQFQTDFTILTNNVNTWVHYIWDWASTNPKYRQEWANQPILWGCNDGAYNYITTGFNENYADLYLLAGTQKQEIRVNLETSVYSRVLWHFLSIREGIVYISGGKSGESSNYWVYTYGNYYAGTKKSLVQSFSLWSNAFYWHCHSESQSFFACVDDKVYKVSHNNPPADYATSGYVVSAMYQGDVWNEMNFKEMRLGYQLNGGSIVVKVRTSFWWSWKTIKTITDWNAKKITANELIKSLEWSPLWSFYEFQVRLDLTPWSWSPLVKRCTTFLQTTDKIW